MSGTFWVMLLVGCQVEPDKNPTPAGAETPADDSATPDTGPHKDTGSTDTSPPDTGDAPSLTWRSALYPEDWAPGFELPMDDGGPHATLQDFSYAGYHAGESELPVPALTSAISVLAHGADPTGASDSTSAIQAAIDVAAEAGGGTVHIPAGTFRIDGQLSITASHVVIAGDGPDLTFLSLTKDAAMTDLSNIRFSGSRTVAEPIALASDLDAGSTVIPLSDVSTLHPGDTVGLGMVITEAFISDHEMDGLWTFSDGERRTLFQRTVLAVDATATPATVTIDVPTRYPLLMRDAADLRVEQGAIQECGITDLSVSTAVGWDAAWSFDRSHAIEFHAAQDCWMQRVHSWAGPAGDGSHHLQSGGVIVSESRRVTIADSQLGYAQNRGGGGNGYLFEVRQSNEVLIRDSTGTAGRHNFIQNWDFGTSGCVFLRTHSQDGQAWADDSGSFTPAGMSEFHHALAMGNLVDSSTADDGWAAVNRLFWSSGAGHTATETVFWNTQGSGSLTSLQYGRGYVIGTQGMDVRTEVTDVLDSIGTAPEDWTEGIGEAAQLTPQSLYEDQLLRRMAR